MLLSLTYFTRGGWGHIPQSCRTYLAFVVLDHTATLYPMVGTEYGASSNSSHIHVVDLVIQKKTQYLRGVLRRAAPGAGGGQ